MNSKGRDALWHFITTIVTAAVTALASVFGLGAI